MAPKRKRTDRGADDEGTRPSPHRPNALPMAHHGETHSGGNRGNRRPSGRQSGRGDVQSSAPAAQQSQPASQTVDTKPSSSLTNPPEAASQKPETTEASKQASFSQPPLVTLMDFYYSVLTDDCISNWANSSADIAKKAIESLNTEDYDEYSAVFQETIRSVMCDRLDPVIGGTLIKEILLHDSDTTNTLSPTRHFIDCFSTFAEGGIPDSTKAKTFLVTSDVSPDLMREQFEHKTLIQLGLVRPQFNRAEARHGTAVLYKQTAFNLLREDTEGYSKLTSEYYLAAERGIPTAELVSNAFEKVKSLVGAFNIDPGRTLDTLMDVFGDMLIKRHRFFVRFLRASSFWPEPKIIDGIEHEELGFSSLPWWCLPDYPGCFFTDDDKSRLDLLKENRDVEFWNRVREVGMQAFWELGGHRITKMPEGLMSLDLSDDGDLKKLKSLNVTPDDANWIQRTKTFPRKGSLVAAQLLGFKLQYYTSDFRDAIPMPDNLIWLAALLIHIGFISLGDLYPYLYPEDEAMAAVKSKLQKEKAERDLKKRPGGGTNALLMAGALVDDTLPFQPKSRELPNKSGPKAEANDPEKAKDEGDGPSLPEPDNQKIMLLKSLLLIGAIPDALFILGRFPWLIEVSPDLLQYINRILYHSLSKVFADLEPLPGRDTLRQEKANASESASLPKGELAITPSPPRKVLRWGRLDSFDRSKDADYKFYWDDWSDNIPVCRTVDDVFTLCSSFLNIAGVRIGEDPELLTQLAQIGSYSITNDQSEANQNRWIDLCKRLLVPALSFTDNNPGCVHAVWKLIETFSISTRYSIYDEWYNGPTSRTPVMRGAFDLARAETKDVLKRISKENIKEMAMALAKITFSSPGIVFKATLSQIEVYNNLIEVVVKCAQYFTPLAFDVLTYSILASLGDSGRRRVQDDGMLTSKWLKYLSNFAGTCFRRYDNMSPGPVLQYVAAQLRSGKSENLEILEQIILSMTGIRSDTNYGDEQLRNMAGGPLLRDLTLKQVLDKRHESKEQSKRLIRALIEKGLTGQLLILIAQEHQNYPFREESDRAPLKVVANNADKIFHAFEQYLDMIKSNLPDQDFTSIVPSIDTLIRDYHLSSSIAFEIHRDDLRRRMEAAEVKKAPGKDEKPQDIKEKSDPTSDTGTPADGDLTMRDAESTSVEPPTNSAKDSTSADIQSEITRPKSINSVLEELTESLRNVLPEGFENSMSLAFYTRFWQLSLYDMSVPKYENEIRRLSNRISSIGSDRKDASHAAAKQRDAERKQIIDLQTSISNEMKSHTVHYQAIRRKLAKEKDQWFSAIPLSKHIAVADSIIQECIYPRAILSPADAIYSYKMLFLTHQMGTPGFRTIQVFDRLFRDQFLGSILFQCTPFEAENFGRFLSEVLKEFSIWHYSKDTYEKNAWGAKNDLGGFARKLTPELKPEVRLEFEDFRRLLYKWHIKLFQAFKACLGSDEYMHLRNGIIVLKAVHQDFPKVSTHGTQIVEAVTNISKNDSREDLKLSALSLLGDLNKRKLKWIPAHEFRIGGPHDVKSKEDSSTTASQSSRAGLDPKASEYHPNKAQNGPTNAPSSAGEVEDGEIDDSKKVAPAATKESAQSKGRHLPPPNKSDSKASTPGPMETNGSSKPEKLQSSGAQGSSKGERPDSRRGASNLPPPPPGAQLPNRPEGDIPKEPITHPHESTDRNRSRQPAPTNSRAERTNDSQRDKYRDRANGEPVRNRSRSPESATGSRRRDPRDHREPPRDLFDRSNRPPQREGPREGPRDALREGPRDALREPRDGRRDDLRDMPRDMRGPVRSDWHDPPRDRGYDFPPDARDRIMDGPERSRYPPNLGPRDPPRRHEDDRQPRRDVNSSQHAPPRREEPLSGPPRTDNRPRQELESQRSSFERGSANDSQRRERRDDGPNPSGPPRSDRPNEAPSRPRELFQQPQRPPHEQSHGRLGVHNDYAPIPQQDPSYGRLNPTAEPPSGPRTTRQASGRGAGRGVGNSQQRQAEPTFGQIPASPSADRPPNGPIADRREPRQPPDAPRAPSSQTAPSGPEATGIHPSRMGQVQDTPSQTSNSGPPTGPRTANRTQGGNYPPSGPANQQPPRNPSGPAAGGDRRHFANINSHLSQAAVPGSDRPERAVPAAPRGRGGRNFSAPVHQSGPPSSVNAQAPPSRDQPPSQPRQDIGPSRSNMPPPDRRGPPQSNHPEGDGQDQRSERGRRRDQPQPERTRSRSPRRPREDGRPREDPRARQPPRQDEAPPRRGGPRGQPREDGYEGQPQGQQGPMRGRRNQQENWERGSQGNSSRGGPPAQNDGRDVGDVMRSMRGGREDGRREPTGQGQGQGQSQGQGQGGREPRKRRGQHEEGGAEPKRPRKSE